MSITQSGKLPGRLAGLLLNFTVAVLFLFASLQLSQAQQVLPGTAKSPASDVSAPSPNDLKELSRLLADPKILGWLRNNAENQTAVPVQSTEEKDTFRQQFSRGIANTRARLSDLIGAWHALPTAPGTIVQIWRSQVSSAETLRSVTFILIFLFVGAALEWLFWQYFTPMRQRLEYLHYETLSGRVRSALLRVALISGALIAFGLGSIGAFLAFEWPDLVQRIVLNLLISVIAIRALRAVARFILSPKVTELRLIPLGARDAKYLYSWITLVTAVTVLGITLTDTFDYLAAFQQDAEQAKSAALSISVLVACVIAVLALISVWRMRAAELPVLVPVVEATAKSSPNALSRVLLTLLIVVGLILWLISGQAMMWTLIILMLIVPAMRIISRQINHLFDQADGERKSPAVVATDMAEVSPAIAGENPPATGPADEAATEDEPETSRYDLLRPVTIRLARFVIFILALILLGANWGISILSLSDADNFAGRAFGIAIDITVAILIADLIWVWAKTAIDRKLLDSGFGDGPAMGGEGGGAVGPEARMATLLPILRKILLVTIIIMVALSVLSALGINIAPLLAGAGVVGVAIGFGAQALVRDIVSGIFFLLDDAFRVGEYIEMENLRGTVESMSLRSLRVRHHRGAVHTIPFGELKSLTNYSRDWVIMKMEFRVPFDTDIKLVKRLIKRVSANLVANEIYGKHFIQPLKSQGVRRMEEFNMVIGLKFMCAPGEQWVIRRDAYQQVRDIFGENGIELAQRNVKVEVVSDKPLTPEEEKAVLAAAQEAAEQIVPPGPQKDEP